MAPSTSTAAAPSAAKPPAKKSSQETSTKETVESILIAFILAFIFRGFVVEAFVIPTGSMAPTLYGAHMRLTCPDCGYVWDVGFHGADETDIPSSGSRTIGYHCPNCGYIYPESPRGPKESMASDQPVRFGDRILVLKYVYLLHGPARWDVVVFKAPVIRSIPGQLPADPADPAYAENYIKRLAGLPGESLVILDGAVYTALGDHELETRPDGSVPGADLFKICRRPEYAQDRLWRTVFDNDYLPHLDRSSDVMQTPWHSPWVSSDSSWQTADTLGRPSRTFHFNSLNGKGWLTFDVDPARDPHQLTDYLPYDELDQIHAWRPAMVSDLKLGCSYTRAAGDGAFGLQLTKRDDVFTARILRGKAALVHSKRGGGETTVGGGEIAVPALGGSRPVRVELSNVDYRVTLKIDGKTVIQTTDAEYGPDVAALFREYDHDPAPAPEVKILAENQQSSIEHISLARNIYYINSTQSYWASPPHIIHLGEGEYFVLGDNSTISGDARTWTQPVILPSEGLKFVEGGRVPAEFMLGKAFFVYWPAGYQPAPIIPFNVVPDFGEMRFIH